MPKARKSEAMASPDKPATAIEPKDYNRIVASANLAALRMVKSEFEVKPQFLTVRLGEKGGPAPELENTVDAPHYDRERGLLIGTVVWHVIVRHKRKTLLKIRCGYVTIYSDIPECEEAHAKIFFETVAPAQSYPYFRQRVAQSAADAMIELPLLPMLKVGSPARGKSSD